MNLDQLALRSGVDPEDLLTAIVDNGYFEYVKIGHGIYDTTVSGHFVPMVEEKIQEWIADKVIATLTGPQMVEQKDEQDEDDDL
jgi:hypothetical protein